MSIKDFFKKEFDNDNGHIIDCAVVGIRTAYLAYQIDKGIAQGKIMAYVCLLDYRPKDHYNFGYKDMDEGMGPNESKCPGCILDILSPVNELGYGENCVKYAQEWRNRCYFNLKSNTKVKDGDKIRFDFPIHFTNGETHQEFKIRKYGKKIRFMDVNALGLINGIYQITGWKDRAHTILS